MNRRAGAIVLGAGLGIGCGGQAPVPSEPAAKSPPTEVAKGPAPAAEKTETLAEDTRLETPSGATFTAPKGWKLTRKNEGNLRLEAPDGDLVLGVVEVSASSGEEAAAEAWKRHAPATGRAVKRASKPPPRDGWDEVVQVDYEAGAEGEVAIAIARRKGEGWFVMLIDGARGDLERRGAQLMTAVASLRGPGAEVESFAGKTAHALDATRLAAFEAFVKEAMASLKVPGASVAILEGGKVVLDKGFGVRELGKSDPVTPSTLFMVGSTTKSLTTLLMAKLVDEGKLAWDDPVTKHLPSLKLGDPEATKKLHVSHTACACTGMPRRDMNFLFEYARATPESRLESMRTMKPTTGLGETFQYSNDLVAAAGYVAAAAARGNAKGGFGPAYDEAMRARVFEPLGMKNTTFDFKAAARALHATPHGRTLSLELAPIPLSYEEGVVAIRPAGGAWSTAADMAKYVALELDRGALPGGKRLVSEASLLERRKPRAKITDDLSYGLGLFVENDHGVRVVHHGGNNLGFTSDLFFLPDHGVGAVVLTNAANAGTFRKVIRRRLLELLFDGREEARALLDFGVRHAEETAKKMLAEVATGPDAAWLQKLSGTYGNAELGRIILSSRGGRGSLDAGEWKSAFGQKKEKNGALKVVLLDAPYAGLELLVGEKGGKTTLELEAGQQKYLFEPAR